MQIRDPRNAAPHELAHALGRLSNTPTSYSPLDLFRYTSPGTLATAGGIVFSGTPDQKFYALDARTGRVLWTFHSRSGFVGQPVSYRVEGKQYVAVQAGYGGVTPFWGGTKVAPLFRGIPLGGTLYVFTL